MLGLFRLWTETADRQAKSVDELLARVSDTVGIAKMIAQLADQCNLLAINAQIEAARAGAHGLGFAVVAQEVRQLADETKSQAGQIREQLGGMAASAAAAAAHVREGKEGADRGMLQVRKAEETFGRLWAQSSVNAKGTEHLETASREASAMSEQIAAQVAKLAAQMNASPEEKY
ncbi:methyl-accepting chemotaxis protein [Cohnella rhizosphaerae]|uniref:Methyl-accepting chemotaxis protein n=1 Tax=Cohnella rhizosphaerae TaxID=1457232 RepID=A0A9X4KNL9_9BACL|nr:methyl-accepting chemotaxis protein [Cohnella rhizosphaerae]MDG0808249.1 methyl-accepting chemotaxis protein [Cohnella rhizosphaerae]